MGRMHGLSPVRRWGRRIVPVVFAVALVGAGVLTIQHDRAMSHATTAPKPAHRFSHSYPANPVVTERPKVTGSAPNAPAAATVSGHASMSSFAELAKRLPGGTLRHEGSRWVLIRPAAVSGGAALNVTGPARLGIAPGAFLLATDGGTVRLTKVHVGSVARSGKPLTRPVARRGFLAATSGGRLILVRDVIDHLGYLGVQAYGLSMEKPGPGSRVMHCTIIGNYFGIYLTHAVGVRMLGNLVERSIVYGIDPHTESTRLVIRGNRVFDSGVHGIILATRVTHSRVVDNVVRGTGLHGIVVFDASNDNTITGNHVSNTFDGLVVTDSSGNVFEGNVIDPARRFGVRVSGRSIDNVFRGNRIVGPLLGVYVYAGPKGTQFLDTSFAGTRENVRVRSDARGTVVRPVPSKSEL
jgi:parallel beta-helix repeat protein